MRKSLTFAAVLSMILISGAASAAPYRTALDTSSSGHSYSLLGGQTVPTGADVVSADVGWPGISFGFTHGTSATSDMGVKFDLLYGFESTTSSNQFGIGLRAPFRFMVARHDKLSFLVHLDPGIKLYTTSPVAFGLQLPVGVTAGYDINPNVVIAFGLDVPMTLFVTPSPVSFYIGPMFGPAIEFHPDRQLTIGLNTRFGPVIAANTYGSASQFGFVTQAVVGYKL